MVDSNNTANLRLQLLQEEYYKKAELDMLFQAAQQYYKPLHIFNYIDEFIERELNPIRVSLGWIPLERDKKVLTITKPLETVKDSDSDINDEDD
jgi:hypothetical protein